ncbi:Hsp70 family protein [filamentous cyanobacterium LEGE 11480]|uniref:Hsp70 family protein n=1 Tax=Romeriopsis navalis LEGE 11480 TaxID=2777977 RepID=A0A928VLJ7_9CYAN|nr:Hsp70 family protein [Romeriopsis navalis]MBE9029862.1 Hsp70 family protein [Romeriopsis navalis LEGE 11480]
MAYAIDFGTSNTVVTRWNSATNQPETLSLEGASVKQAQNPPLIPSLLYVEDAAQSQVVIGQAVRDRGLDVTSDARFFRNFKRGIGADLQGFLPELDGQAIRFEQVGQWYLEQVIQQFQATEPEISQSLTFTVPVDSFESYRLWLGQVAQRSQIEQVRLLDEPTAAALGYGLADQEVLLVIDFGGGTLDLSLVRLAAAQSSQPSTKPLGFILKWGDKDFAQTSGQKNKVAQVLAKAGLNIGGADLDNWILNHFVKTQELSISPVTLRLAERLKIQLSLQTQAQEVYFNDETFDSYDLQLERAQFEEILKQQQFFEKLDGAMGQIVQQAQRQGLELSDVNAVLLVGGTSQIPAVQTWVQTYFDTTKIRSNKPFEAIAQGALQISQNVEVKDFLYHGYGIRYWDRRIKAHNWHSIIRPGQPYPMNKPVELTLGASIEDQPQIELVIGELAGDNAQTEVYFDGDRLITRNLESSATAVKALNDSDAARGIAELDPPGSPGRDRIKVMFSVNQKRFLCITVEDLLTQRTLLSDQPVVQLS